MKRISHFASDCDWLTTSLGPPHFRASTMQIALASDFQPAQVRPIAPRIPKTEISGSANLSRKKAADQDGAAPAVLFPA
jgi:hypothetical protein